MPSGPQWRQAIGRNESEDLEDSLLRAMDDDPRLGSGAAVPRGDNVLDFIQMTGLTTGRVPASSTPRGEDPDDPINFFEYGVRDVDGSGDPEESHFPDAKAGAFSDGDPADKPVESHSLAQLRGIIADLAATEAEADETADTLFPQPRAEAVAPNGGECDADQPTQILPQTADIEYESAVGRGARYESPMKSPQGLAAARELLHELSQANDAAQASERAIGRTPSDTAARDDPAPLPWAGAPPAVDLEDQTTHHGLSRRRSEPTIWRWIARGAIVLVAAGMGYGAWVVYERAVQPPRAAFEAAQSLLDSGRYEEASNAFLAFARRYEGNPRRSDALFNAGMALQQAPDQPATRAKQAYTESIELLRHFIEEYPAHEKTPRAETAMGVLFFRTGRYLEAVNILGDPDRRLRDPGGYLTALRTLGRSYAALSQTENARSAFMRAAALESNMTPDADYTELAGIYTQLAERSGDPVQRRRHFQQAIEQWDFALQVPGLLKSRKDEMKLLRDVAASKLERVSSDASAGELPGVRSRTSARGTPGGNSSGIAPIR